MKMSHGFALPPAATPPRPQTQKPPEGGFFLKQKPAPRTGKPN
jgi:hypothetical protein